MSKLEKIYTGFYGYGSFSIEQQISGWWAICDKNNRFIDLKRTLKDAIRFIDFINAE